MNTNPSWMIGSTERTDTMTARLSKSKILSGLQCEKRLWLEVHQPELKVVAADVTHLFAIGNEVNDVARALHKNGRLVDIDGGISGALAETERILDESPKKPVFEATFVHEGVVVRVDILKNGARGYRLIEVKASTKVKPPHYPDCAVQAWVLENFGLPLARVELAHINNQFVYRGDGDYRGLLHHENLSTAIAEIKKEVPQWVSRFKGVLNGGKPDIETGAHCNDPYPCPFIEHCARPGTDYPVSGLPNGKKISKQLEAEGINDIRDIPPGRLNSATHEWVRKVTAEGKPDLNPAAKGIINACPYPRYYLDFESISFAVPVWKDTRPYQQLPFQWSCHVETKPGQFSHEEFLDTTGDAPMRPFIESLLTLLEKSGAIFVYSSFEKSRLNEIAARFPDLQEGIKKVTARLVDLLPVTKQNYYHPDMLGSWSLKAVLPTIAPHLDYGDLGEIQDGTAAGTAYLEIIHADTTPVRAQSLAADLRKYCKRDTEALVALVQFLSSGEIR